MNFIKRFSAKTQHYNLCLVEIFSILHLLNLKRNIDVISLEEPTSTQVLLPKPMEDKMYRYKNIWRHFKTQQKSNYIIEDEKR